MNVEKYQQPIPFGILKAYHLTNLLQTEVADNGNIAYCFSTENGIRSPVLHIYPVPITLTQESFRSWAYSICHEWRWSADELFTSAESCMHCSREPVNQQRANYKYLPACVQGDTLRVTVTNAVSGSNAPATSMHFHGFSVSPAYGQVHWWWQPWIRYLQVYSAFQH